ncbi:TPA: MerR family transcriptional regulator, partial [Legionella pneumophila]|nr:MerR family transcriptional regulator [Legionella pneumophila]HAT6093559.1 MerR family transcriptional regulator [Legionella pneumophila]HAT6323370.1 MerR family transcriptional regulator [Legionella pneumophila]HAT6337054.1 MerR family transcriptional regulator [Legionella pneumophila]HAT6372194.1 MerR family transcriptional regulator [Legionella pneumophila]
FYERQHPDLLEFIIEGMLFYANKNLD